MQVGDRVLNHAAHVADILDKGDLPTGMLAEHHGHTESASCEIHA